MASSSMTLAITTRRTQPLALIDSNSGTTPVVVKLLRRWFVWMPFGGPRPSSLEMVLADAEGTTIQGHVDRKHIYKHDELLHEGQVYLISKYDVLMNTGKFRATRHEYRLGIHLHTAVRPAASSDSIQDPEIIFTPPYECFQESFNMNYYVDIAGLLVGVEAEHEFARNGGKSTRMNVQLENRGYRFKVTLFGEYVTQVKEFISSSEANNAVLVFQWAKVDPWIGGRSLQTSGHTTRLLINPFIAEAVALRESMTPEDVIPTLTLTKHTKGSGSNETFLDFKEKHEIFDVIQLLHVKEFVVLATIDGFNLAKPWWYWGHISCFKKVEEDSGMYYCDKCVTHVTNVNKRFFLQMMVSDELDYLEVVVFDQNVRALVDKSCDAVYEAWESDAERGELPCEVKDLIGKQVLIKINAKGEVGSRFGRQYMAVNISADLDLIARYQLKWNNEGLNVDAPDKVLLFENTPSDQSVEKKELTDELIATSY